jgi:transglutaminase-like putative cysteine protease
MMKLTTTLIILILAAQMQTALATEYAVKNIPADLLTEAHVISRFKMEKITLHDAKSYTRSIKQVITIMNENGKHEAALLIPYDKHTRARFIKGEILDAAGKRLRKLKTSDLTDQSRVFDVLYNDNRVLSYHPEITSYPYTVIYEYEVKVSNRGLYYLNAFSPQTGYNQSSEHAVFMLEYPNNLNIRLKEYHAKEASKTLIYQGHKIRETWTFHNISARPEGVSNSFYADLPIVLFSPIHFVYDGYRGSSETWEEYGKWVWNLNKEGHQLSAERIDYLNELVKDISGVKDKAQAIFNDLQTRTRYVNIGMGVSGMQPLNAETVDRSGYGDCKALSNYYVAMLHAVGIQSYYTLIHKEMGNYDFYPNFPTNQFNHAIVCIPLDGDTLWVDCTSKQIPFGLLGINEPRYALMVTEKGGKLVKTPLFQKEDKFQETSATPGY